MIDNLFTVDMKSLNQVIKNPTVGAGNANGAGMRIIFSQEADRAFSDMTQVYLKWYHEQKKIQGYDAFKEINNCHHRHGPKPNVWEIKWPKGMLTEGDVTCTIELVDDVSIVSSNNFIVHVLKNPHDGGGFIPSDDYTIFQEAVIALNRTMKDAQHMMRRMRNEFSNFERQIDNIEDIADGAKAKAMDVEERLRNHIALSDEEHELFKQQIEELQNTAGEVTTQLQTINETISTIQQQQAEDIQTLNTSIETLAENVNSSITELTNTVSENKQELDNKITETSNSIAAINDTMEDIQQQVETISETSEDTEEKFANIDAQFEEQTQRMNSLEEEVQKKHTINMYT